MLRCLLALLLTLCLAGPRLVYADVNFSKRPDVHKFINLMVKKHKLNRAELVKLFDQVKYHEIVIKHVNKPLEANPWRTYQRLFVNEWRIKHGVTFWRKHAAALKKAEDLYGVPPSIIVATLGVETKYGERTGNFRVIDSLTSLGFSNSKRAPFFRKELEQFLLLTHEQHLNPLKVTGSYAGAIGMPQFIPSSYRHYATSFTKKDTVDLMNNTDDVIASIANYYQKNGWIQHDPVAVSANVNLKKYDKLPKPKNPKQPVTVKTLEKYGVTPLKPIADKNAKAKLIELQSSDKTDYWVGFGNFDVIRRYNPNDLYAMAVYQLSKYITELKARES